MPPAETILSIDQNCHPLWDVVPKLHALTRKGRATTHLVEDIDVAFTALGAEPDDPLRLVRERFHHSGGQDWGAAMFYSEFLGTLPLDLRDLQPQLGQKLSAVAKKTGSSVEDLYNTHSPGDNWQLIGPSYVTEDTHRVIGDLSVAETAPFLREMLDVARGDMDRSFPSSDSRKRTAAWFEEQRAMLDDLLARHEEAALVDLYDDWLAQTTTNASAVGRTSEHFALDRMADEPLVQFFLSDYTRAAELYNQALKDADSSLHPLNTKRGELPLFATLERDGRRTRTGMHLTEDNAVRIAGDEFALDEGHLPVELLRQAGVRAVAGKAVLLVLQVRCGRRGCPLALPRKGSLYTPASYAFQRQLEDAGKLPGPVAPILRVRLGLLDRLGELDTPIRLPAYLARVAGCLEMPASGLAEAWRTWQREAAERLEQFRCDQGREQWQRSAMAETFGQIDEMDSRRRELARENPKGQEIRDLSHRIRELESDVLRRTLDQIILDTHVSQLDYWDSRGATWPWCIALGGQAFYDRLLDEAEISPETAETA
jgi:hypothetical protein